MDISKLKIGEIFTLKLKGLASAGYQWEYAIDNKNAVSITKEYKLDEPLTQKNMGSSANEIFTITALKKGIVNLNFFQKRSWEDDTIAPINQKKIQIIIG